MADPATLPPLPKNHLDHPENWATGAEPATEKQKGFIKVLEGQHPESVPEGGIDVAEIGKSEASEVIDKLKNGEKVTSTGSGDAKKTTEAADSANAEAYDEMKETEDPKTSMQAGAGSSEKSTEAKPSTPHRTSAANGEKRKSPPEVSARTDKDDSKAHDGDEQMKGDDEEAEAEDADAPEGERLSKKARTNDFEAKKTSESKADKSPSSGKRVNGVGTGNVAAAGDEGGATGDADTAAKESANASKDGTIPGDDEHLDHPENWTTGDEPATEKQKGYLAVLEKKAGEPVENMQGLGKSEASAKIDELK